MTLIALIALLMEWVLVITTLAPLVLGSGRLGASRPRAAIVLWFTSLLVSGIASLAAFLIAIAAAIDFWSQLEGKREAPDRLVWGAKQLMAWPT